MTPEEQRIAIAEACGWRCCKADYDLARKINSYPCTNLVGVASHAAAHIDGSKDYHYHLLPDYEMDLNAMREAESVIVNGESEQRSRWFIWMQVHGDVAGIHATARQRAEAFLRTVGKWVES